MEGQNDDCRAIVMEYLLHYCYKNSAKALLKEMRNLDSCAVTLQPTNDTSISNCLHKSEKEPCGFLTMTFEIDSCINTKSQLSLLDEKNIEWNSVDARKDIHDAIQQGDIGKAFALMEQHFPALIRTYNTINRMESQQQTPPRSHFILYKLRCQQFIETLRISGDLEAIQFAQYYLRPCHKLYTNLTNSVITLIAYTDLENDKTKDLLSQNRRDAIADEVNEMILESQKFSPQTALEKLWRQKIAVQVELDNQKRQELLKDQKEAESLEKVPM